MTWGRGGVSRLMAAAGGRGGDLFPAFMAFLQAKGGEEGEKEQELVSQLREINDALAKSDGPFLVRRGLDLWSQLLFLLENCTLT